MCLSYAVVSSGCSGNAPDADGTEPQKTETEVEETPLDEDTPVPDGADALVLEASGDVKQSGKTLRQGNTVVFQAPVVVGNGRAVLRVRDTGVLKLFPNSRIVLEKRSVVRLIAGRVWSRITAKRFEVDTENAVAGVRGTDFVVDADKDSSDVSVLEGEVEVKNRAAPDKVQRVSARKRTKVKQKAPPSEPEDFDPEDIHKLWDKVRFAIRDAAKDAAKQGAKTVKEAGKEVGQGVKKGLKEVGDSPKQGAREVGKGFQKGAKTIKEDVKSTFKKIFK
jgi:hypothetical protein